jgi:hypothetical protein
MARQGTEAPAYGFDLDVDGWIHRKNKKISHFENNLNDPFLFLFLLIYPTNY